MGSLRLFENLKTLDVEHGLLVDLDAIGDFNIVDLLPTFIEAIDMTGKSSRIISHIRPFIIASVSSTRANIGVPILLICFIYVKGIVFSSDSSGSQSFWLNTKNLLDILKGNLP